MWQVQFIDQKEVKKLKIKREENKMIEFYKVRNTKCDFCNKLKKVVTQANFTYICVKCACEINKHARINEEAVKKKLKEQLNEPT